MDRARTFAKWAGIVLAALIMLVALVLLGLNTAPGRRLVADQVSAFRTASGLNFKVGRIDGSIYGAMTLHDVRVSDPKGVFLTAPEIAVDWDPFQYLRNHIDVASVTAPLVTMTRTAQLRETPSDPDAPLLPDLDIDIDRLRVERVVLGPAIAGSTRVLRVAGAAHIADRRAQLRADIAALAVQGIRGGDRVTLTLDAVPDDNRLALAGRVLAPAGGAVASILGLSSAAELRLDGRGSWQAWNGRLLGTLGGTSLADLTITARDGTFTVAGMTHPSLYLSGPVERLTAPGLAVNVVAALDRRIADTRLTLRSDALAVVANGKLDLGASRFDRFVAEARLLTPGAIAPNLSGRDIRARVALDGAFARPTVDYKLSAAAIGFDETRVEGVYAEGLATIDADRILVPVKARARRIAGLNPAIGGLVTNVAITGDLAYGRGKILSDNLRIRSDRIDATAVVAADLAAGRYNGALKGKVANYLVESVGILDLTTDAQLVTTPSGGFAIRGRVAARTQRIFNDGARTFLGGNAFVRTDLTYGADGTVAFSNLRLNAPQFRVTRGSGRYTPGGSLLVDADAYSTRYGPLTARVTGTLDAPQVLLRAARPGVGVGLVNLEARVRGANGAYAVVATGGTDYGPFSADVLVRPGATLGIDVNRVRFAGVTATGRVQQTRAGPFAGSLSFAGSGLAGDVRLADQGGLQRADINARANAARIPGAVDFTIGRALVTASILLADRPQVVVDVQVANLRYGGFTLSTARAKVNYRSGSGTVQAVVNGSSGVPFTLGVNGRLTPRDWLFALKGQANGIAFRTGPPLHIQPFAEGYRLLPSRIDFSKGAVRLAGEYGRGLTLRARLDDFDLAVLNAITPSLGLGGTASGSLDFQQQGAAVPAANAQLTIRNFTRASLTATSTPVDVVLASELDAGGGDLGALIRTGNKAIGRVVARLSPLGSGAGWSDRLSAAPLSGGIRYNGPATVPFSLAGLSGQQLTGPIAIAADFSGRVDAPQLVGVVRADNLTYDNETYGTRLSNLALRGRFDTDRLQILQLQAKAGDGTVSAQGTIGLSATAGFPIDLTARLNNARLARSDALGATATGDIHITNGRGGGLISGTLTIPEARYSIIRQGAAEVPELAGVRRKSDVVSAVDAPTPPALGAFKLDVRIRADNRLFVSGMGLESEWSADLRVSGTNRAPRVSGRIDLIRGTYSFAGKRFDVTRGMIRFEGGALSDPVIDIEASTTTNGITAIINVSGTGQRPQVAFTSSPVLPQDEVLSRLLFGSSPTNLSAIQALQLAAALNSLRGTGGGLNPLGKLRSATGFDRLRILGSDEASGRGTALAAGKYLTDDIYIEIVTDARGFTATQLELALTKSLSVLSQAGSFGGSNVSLRYSKDF